MYEIPDQRIPDTGEADYYTCPVCGAEIKDTDYLYVDRSGDVIGCEHCICERQAYEVVESEHEKEDDARAAWEEDRYRD